MKAVLISIQPKWCEKIANGEKTIEVRKSRPKLETPFKCYIYETKGKQVENLDGCDITYYGRGKVIGEFVCDRIDSKWFYISVDGTPITNIEKDFETLSCLKRKKIIDYALLPNKALKVHNGTMFVYGWHISDLKIYDKPKELSEFMKAGKGYYCDISCKHLTTKGKPLSSCDRYCDKYETYLYYNDSFLRCNECLCENCVITSPPQSWCYVEELK